MQLSKTMRDVLRVLAASGQAERAATIALRCGFNTGQDKGRHAHDGRSMSPAQRVIFPLTALRKLGLVGMARRRDGLSGTAYVITEEGRKLHASLPWPVSS